MKSLKTLMYNGIKYFSAFFFTQKPLAFLCFSYKSFKLLILHMEVKTMYRSVTLEPKLPHHLFYLSVL